mmetsp:Transcript_62676/g.168051  ORF Transcript_62676/g.168051 Transcript_62676/m.168051 type:complete len:237 (+) Transcript_62676:60-770(+)
MRVACIFAAAVVGGPIDALEASVDETMLAAQEEALEQQMNSWKATSVVGVKAQVQAAQRELEETQTAKSEDIAAVLKIDTKASAEAARRAEESLAKAANDAKELENYKDLLNQPVQVPRGHMTPKPRRFFVRAAFLEESRSVEDQQNELEQQLAAIVKAQQETAQEKLAKAKAELSEAEAKKEEQLQLVASKDSSKDETVKSLLAKAAADEAEFGKYKEDIAAAMKKSKSGGRKRR